MAANKLIVTDEQKEDIQGYASKGLSTVAIAKKMKVSQPTMWRIMEEMGLNHKKKKCANKKKNHKIFNWNNFNGTVI